MAGAVGQHGGVPEPAGVVQQGLVVERYVGRSRHAAAARHTHGSRRGIVESQQDLFGDLAEGDLPDAEEALHLVGVGRLTSGNQGGDAVLVVERNAEGHALEPERAGDAVGYELAIVLT